MYRALGILATVFALAALWGTAYASSSTVGTGAGNAFSADAFPISQGDSVIFSNTDDRPHNLNSLSLFKGNFLFGTSTLAPGTSQSVGGVEYLSSGTYRFFCSLHPGMEADLIVGPGGAPSMRPLVMGTLIPGRKRVLARKGLLRFELRSAVAVPGLEFDLISGNRRILSGSADLAAGVSEVISVSLPRPFRQKIASLRSTRISVRGSVPFGTFSGSTRTFK